MLLVVVDVPEVMMGFAVPVTLLFSLIFLMQTEVGCAAACSSDEYTIHGICCRKCLPGSYVSYHCTLFTETSCAPCPEETYTAVPNGRSKCYPCNNCYTDPGLKVKSPCSSTSNALCEPSEGFYCVYLSDVMCVKAQQHRSCTPGQYVLQRGTSSTDTECADCTGGTYSDGTFTACQQHTDCESTGRHLIKAGNDSSDSTCEKISHSTCETLHSLGSCGAVVVFVVGVVFIAVGTIVGGFANIVFPCPGHSRPAQYNRAFALCCGSYFIGFYLLYVNLVKFGHIGYFIHIFIHANSGLIFGVSVGCCISVLRNWNLCVVGVLSATCSFVVRIIIDGGPLVACTIGICVVTFGTSLGLLILKLMSAMNMCKKNGRQGPSQDPEGPPGVELQELVERERERSSQQLVQSGDSDTMAARIAELEAELRVVRRELNHCEELSLNMQRAEPTRPVSIQPFTSPP